MTETTQLEATTDPSAATGEATITDASAMVGTATSSPHAGLLGTIPLEPLTPDAATPEEAATTAERGASRGRRRAALSPSRAKDFQQCPLLFRYRTVDRLPE